MRYSELVFSYESKDFDEKLSVAMKEIAEDWEIVDVKFSTCGVESDLVFSALIIYK